MFKNFPGYKVLEKIQKNKSHKRERKLPINAIKLIFIVAITAIIALLPTESFGIEGLTVVHQRIIALFVFAALMWLTETLPSWVTSMIVVTVMLLTVSTSALSPLRTEKTTKAESLEIAYKKFNSGKDKALVNKDSLYLKLSTSQMQDLGKYELAKVELDNAGETLEAVKLALEADTTAINEAKTKYDVAKAEFDTACVKIDVEPIKNYMKAEAEFDLAFEKFVKINAQKEAYKIEKEANLTKKEEKAFTPYVPFKDILGCFANPTIMLFIGGFVLAIGLTKVKLDVALARVLLKPFGTRSNVVLLGFILVTAIFSAFVSNTATAAMMLAFLTPVLKSLPADGKGRIALALAIPVGANLGGMITPIGTPPNMIALDYLSTQGMGISFVDWTIRMAPFVILLLVLAWMLLRFLFPFKQKNIKIEIDGDIKWNFHML